MQVRQATQQDWQAIKSLIALFPNKLKQTNLTSYRSFFVAEENGEVVGCCAAAVMVLEDPADATEAPKEMEIRSLAVKPGFEGQGIGTALVAACEQRRHKLGVKQGLTFASEQAKKIFERLGYQTSTEWKHAMFKE